MVGTEKHLVTLNHDKNIYSLTYSNPLVILQGFRGELSP